MNSITITNTKKIGYLEIILGGMYAGKTKKLIEIYNQCKFCGVSVMVINHKMDNRYDDELLSTHDKVKIKCVKTELLMDLYTENETVENTSEYNDFNFRNKCKLIKSDVILINEGQFFPDIEEFIKKLLVKGKEIYVCGLDGDFERKKFGKILDLIPLCDKVYKLTSLCGVCKTGKQGIFSKRITRETQQLVIGSDTYIPVCRACYEN
jgi:thymidine kinase